MRTHPTISGRGSLGSGASRDTETSLVPEILRITTHTGLPGRIAMHLTGPLDSAGAAVLMDETSRCALQPGNQLVVHLEEVTVLEQAGVNALAYVDAFVRARGGQMTISAASTEITESLVRAGMERLLVVGAQRRRPSKANG